MCRLHVNLMAFAKKTFGDRNKKSTSFNKPNIDIGKVESVNKKIVICQLKQSDVVPLCGVSFFNSNDDISGRIGEVFGTIDNPKFSVEPNGTVAVGDSIRVPENQAWHKHKFTAKGGGKFTTTLSKRAIEKKPGKPLKSAGGFNKGGRPSPRNNDRSRAPRQEPRQEPRQAPRPAPRAPVKRFIPG